MRTYVIWVASIVIGVYLLLRHVAAEFLAALPH
jgi:hypothetical protein